MKTAYDNGWLTEAEIDARVTKILEFIEKTQNDDKKITTTKAQRHEKAVEIARAGIVLLKNEDNILPLQSGNILVDGIKNRQPVFGGGGSAFVTTDYKSKTLTEELAARMPDANVYSSRALLFSNCIYESSEKKKDLYEKAYHAGTVVLCVGTNVQLETEFYDRETLRLPVQQEELIINTSKINKNLVVVLNVGSAIDMRAWINEVKAVVLAGFGGEGMHEAVADILSGKACPMGKLSETYPLCLEDAPSIQDKVDGYSIRYEEGVFIGYRWYDKKQKEVLFPFGHGLSYAKFDYSDLQVNKLSETDYEVSFTVKNNSAVDGAEISQVYIRDPFASVPRPEKELKGFAKTALKAGESKRVCITLNARSFAYYSTVKKNWYVENGDFEILVGASSKDIRLTERIVIQLAPNQQQSQQ
ncbi:MAG: glycoside hydrolase family 3 C-terminal domain-containing protein [Clostridia bacterium]|nr:glycoside hydrolase family 3 C-terminal domain-containing protein [Clostridia bacterium]